MFILASQFWEIQFANSFIDHLNNIDYIFSFQGSLIYWSTLARNIYTTYKLFSFVKTPKEKNRILAIVALSILREFCFVDLLKMASALLYIASPLFQLRFIFINKLKLSQSNYKWSWALFYVLSIKLFFYVNQEALLMQISSEVY
jgi:hypothetical protein